MLLRSYIKWIFRRISILIEAIPIIGYSFFLQKQKLIQVFALVYPQLPVILGQKLACYGNRVHYLLTDGNVYILSFPTKHHWRGSSSLSLIENSAETLAELAILKPYCTFILTRPGCGLGHLSWSVVKNSIAIILPDNCWVVDRNPTH